MSGFAGIVRMERRLEFVESDGLAIERMAGAIAFRGPDGVQQTQLEGASFAFSLLTTGPSPQAPSQPFTVDDGKTWLLGDARCDGRDELIFKLGQSGVRLSPGATSEELILRWFEHYGASGLPELNGDFSFVLWNPRQRRLFAYRDLAGPRPFFYSNREGVLLFSNTMQAMHASDCVSRELEEQFLGDFLLGFPNFDPALTVYRDIRRLPPGHLLEFSEQGFSVRRIAHMPIEDLLKLKNDEEYVEEFLRLLDQAVWDRLPAHETTIMLSGGLDSTTIAARAVATRRSLGFGTDLKLRAFSVDSQPLFNDHETELASRFATQLGIPCDVVHSGDVLPFSDDDRIHPSPEPLNNEFVSSYQDYCRRIARYSRVAFSGDGGDEVLRLEAMPYLRFVRKQRGVLEAASILAKYIIFHRRIPPLGAGIRTRFFGLLGRRVDPALYTFPTWLNPDFVRRFGLQARWQQMNSRPQSIHPFNPRAYESANNLSVASVSEISDATWSGYPTEIRSPFLDRRLVRHLLRIPLVPWAMEKHLLRRSQVGILPDEILYRKKTPLQSDDLLLHLIAGNWNPLPLPKPPASLEWIVDWPSVIGQLQSARDASLHQHLRPVALARWLKIVENIRPIQ